jgi:hypothetical protein
LVNPGQLQWLIDNRAQPTDKLLITNEALFNEIEAKTIKLLQGIKEHTRNDADIAPIAMEINEDVKVLLGLPILGKSFQKPGSRIVDAPLTYVDTGLINQPDFHLGDPLAWGTLLGWIFTHNLGKMVSGQDYASISRAWIDEWLLGKIIADTLKKMGLSDEIAWKSVGIIKILVSHQDWSNPLSVNNQPAYHIFASWLSDNEFQRFMGVNRYQDILWFNKEAFQEILWWMYTCSVIKTCQKTDQSEELSQEIVAQHQVILELLKAAEESGYKVEPMLEALKHEPR